MRKQHIIGFFDTLVRTPVFLFLCAMFLCGAMAGGLTGLHASQGDNAFHLAAFLEKIPAQTVRSILYAILWIALPLICIWLRPASLFLSGLCAARGFILALTIAISINGTGGFLVSLCTAGIPALLFVPALLAACAIAWQSGESHTAFRHWLGAYFLCGMMAAASALLRAALVAFL